jgi:hypothetical protein
MEPWCIELSEGLRIWLCRQARGCHFQTSSKDNSERRENELMMSFRRHFKICNAKLHGSKTRHSATRYFLLISPGNQLPNLNDFQT